MSNKNIRLAMSAAIALPVGTTVRPAAGQSYDVIDLGTLGGADIHPPVYDVIADP